MLLIPILVYIGIFVFVQLVADRIIFQPQPAAYRDSNEVIKIAVGNGETISAIHLSNSEARYTIFFSHGNAEDIGASRATLDRLTSLGFSVFAYDYRGYGTSSGISSEAHSYEDAEAAYKYLVEDLAVPSDRIILLGRSLGGAVALDLASRRRVGGLILESSFVSAFRVITKIPIFPFDKFNSLSKIKKVDCPILVIHGTRDEVIPFWHGQRLFEEAHIPKQSLWVEGAGHNNVMRIAGVAYDAAIIDFSSSIE
jgi:fermentation-respiration switch protein FrsA (DUF1100 family)